MCRWTDAGRCRAWAPCSPARSSGDGTFGGRVTGRGADLSLLLPAPAVPFTAGGRVRVAGGLAAADDLAGDVGGAPVKGAVELRVAPALRLDLPARGQPGWTWTPGCRRCCAAGRRRFRPASTVSAEAAQLVRRHAAAAARRIRPRRRRRCGARAACRAAGRCVAGRDRPGAAARGRRGAALRGRCGAVGAGAAHDAGLAGLRRGAAGGGAAGRRAAHRRSHRAGGAGAGRADA